MNMNPTFSPKNTPVNLKRALNYLQKYDKLRI